MMKRKSSLDSIHCLCVLHQQPSDQLQNQCSGNAARYCNETQEALTKKLLIYTATQR